ncbi:hypothetical protein [Massilia sp. S19_KUP03_FR1]|uniref:hypothetical protein n=1 Tax=Massilia sp. S19_KUP03_FR1 TaxID=3025503 RepID=UPI002FCDA1DA
MDTVLYFESRQNYHVLRQDEEVETAPFITLQLVLTDGPTIYASDFSVISKAGWNMTIWKRGADEVAAAPLGSVQYAVSKGKPHCVIEVHQSAERFASLLALLKCGHPSEITVVVDGLTDKSDYSKDWNTAQGTIIRVKTLSFEFPLPEREL